MDFTYIWGVVSYLGALIIATYLVAKKIERRPHFVIRAVLSIAGIFLYKICFDQILGGLVLADINRLFLRTMDSFALYTLCMLAVGMCYQCDIWAMLFCATSGYCLQHMSQRTYLTVHRLFLPGISEYAAALLLLLVTAAFYLALYQAIVKKANYRGVMLDSRIQIMVSLVSVIIMIFLNSFALSAASGLSEVRIYLFLHSALCAFLAFFVEFGWLAAKKAEIENGMMRQMAEAAQKNYMVESNIVETMNIAMHDLKHMLSMLTNSLDANVIEGLQQTVSTYDSIFRTGNHALDVTLTCISLICSKKNITFTCSVDGSKLQFLSEVEIYSLFTNLLENAIEAVDRIETPGKRLISLTTRDTQTAFIIHEENYLGTTPAFEDGLPKTTKEDTLYHGFGTKSIRVICEKYGGVCSMDASDGIFEVDIKFLHAATQTEAG